MRTPDGTAVVTLLTPAGALLDGDDVRLTVECHPGSNVTLRQAGATRLLRCGAHGIRVSMDVWVGAGACFRYLPYELIPFAGADCVQTIRLHLEQGAEVRVVEVVSPGRLQEHFRYRRLRLRTEVCLDGEVIVVDAQDIEPERDDCVGLLGGFTHFGSALILGPGLGQQEADRVHEHLVALGVLGSASLLPSYGIGARVVGKAADPLLAALHRLPV